MGSALDYLPSLAMGTKTVQTTGVAADGFVASGYASLIQSITGSQPTLVLLGGKKVRMLLSPQQVETMKKWLDGRVAAGLKVAKSPSNLEIDARPFVMPVVLKYAVPVAAVLFFAGWFAHSFIGKR